MDRIPFSNWFLGRKFSLGPSYAQIDIVSPLTHQSPVRCIQSRFLHYFSNAACYFISILNLILPLYTKTLLIISDCGINTLFFVIEVS